MIKHGFYSSRNNLNYFQQPYSRLNSQNQINRRQSNYIRSILSTSNNSRNLSYHQNYHQFNSFKPNYFSSLHHKNNKNNYTSFTKKQQHNFIHHSRVYSPYQEQNFSRCKSEIIKSHSLNQIQRNQRIQMLSKLNSALANYSNQSVLSQTNYQQSKTLFQNHMNAKIDRLQKYLVKIKRQRQRQEIPKNKIQQEVIKPLTQEVEKNSVKEGLQKALLELDKLKSQISKVRNHAIQVQKRNSISRQKNIKKIQIEVSPQKFKEQLRKLSNLQQQLAFNSKLNLKHNFAINQQLIQQPKKPVISSANRTNNHIQQYDKQSSFRFQNSQVSNSYFSNNITNSMNNSKPKVVFSFANKR